MGTDKGMGRIDRFLAELRSSFNRNLFFLQIFRSKTTIVFYPANTIRDSFNVRFYPCLSVLIRGFFEFGLRFEK